MASTPTSHQCLPRRMSKEAQAAAFAFEFFFHDLAGVSLLRDMARLAHTDPGLLHQIVRRARDVNGAGDKADEQGE